MKAIANLMMFFAASAVILMVTGILLKLYWTVFMIGWGML